jgi:hypothetical protein
VITADRYTGSDEADVEDLIGRRGYVALIEKCYGLAGGLKLPEIAQQRVVKDVEESFRVLPPAAPEFDHFAPASFLIENPGALEALPGAADALDRFEKLFADLNALL